MKKRAYAKSKRGVSLVEEVCAVFILVLGVFAAAAAIGLARTSVASDSVKEGAAATAQELADSLVAELSQKSAVPEAIANAANSGQPVGVGGVQAVNVGSEDGFGSSAAANRFCILPDPAGAVEGGNVTGYYVVCRAYYGGGKEYVQMKAYASACGNSADSGG